MSVKKNAPENVKILGALLEEAFHGRKLNLNRLVLHNICNFVGDVQEVIVPTEYSNNLFSVKRKKIIQMCEENIKLSKTIHLEPARKIYLNYVKLSDWSFVEIPKCVEVLDLTGTNFNDNLSHLINLKRVNLSGVDLKNLPCSNLPKSFKTLVLKNNGSKFDWDLRYLSGLEHLILNGVYLSDWKKIKWPKNIKKMELDRTNFKGDLGSLNNLLDLTIDGVKLSKKEWGKTRFPPNLTKLSLKGTDFSGDLSYLVDLEMISLAGVQSPDWEPVRFPLDLQKLYLFNSNFHGDLSYLRKNTHCQIIGAFSKHFESKQKETLPRVHRKNKSKKKISTKNKYQQEKNTNKKKIHIGKEYLQGTKFLQEKNARRNKIPAEKKLFCTLIAGFLNSVIKTFLNLFFYIFKGNLHISTP